MANAVTKVPMATVMWGDDKIERPLETQAANTIFYPGAMMALNAAGNAVKGDDTAGNKFDGINAESVRVEVFAGDPAGARVVKVERPFRFAMAIAAAVAGDEGKAIYAVDDCHVGYFGSVTNNILVGWVDQVQSATSVLVKPAYEGTGGLGSNGLAGADLIGLTPLAASGALAPHTAATYVVTKAGVAALTLAAPTAGVDDGVTIAVTSSTAFAHTLTATGLLNTGSVSVNVATFAAFAGATLKLMAYQGKWNVVYAVGITFS